MMHKIGSLRLSGWIVALALTVSACGGGGGGDTATGVATPASPVPAAIANPSPAEQPVVPGAQADALAITGEPSDSVVVGENYEFQPEASDSGGEALTFSIANLPSWAQFDTATGMLQGTPGEGDVGTYQNVTISVSAADRTETLAPFTIEVVQMATGSATVSWTPPIKNTDGTVLKDLKGYHIHYGRSSGKLNRSVKIKNASISRYVIENLSSGTWYFAVSAFNSKEILGSMSNVKSKVIP